MKPEVRKIFKILQHFTKEIVIALILAVVAAVGYEIYNHEIYKRNIQANKKAVATVFVFDKDRNALGQGSGVFINASGLLVTNYHVIEGTDITKAIAKLSTGAQYSLRGIRGIDKGLDIALLQFEGIETPHVVDLGTPTSF